MAIQQVIDFTEFRDLQNLLFFVTHFQQFLSHRLLHEYAFRILRQHGQSSSKKFSAFIFIQTFPFDPDLPAIRSANAADTLQHSGFPRTVPSNYCKDAALGDLKIHASQHVRRILFIAEPDFLHDDG